MAVCKECGALNPDSNKFCSECGQLIVKLDSKAIRDAVSQLEAEFEQDALVSLDRSRLTYICDVCGKVNPIDAKQCLRCGKKRPRTDYINALTKIKNSKNLKTAVDSMQKIEEKPAPVVAAPPVAPPKEEPVVPPAPILPKEEPTPYVAPQEAMQLYRLNPQEGQGQGIQQTRQIIQPFVIVPYVSQNQPLLQYNPDQIYRYEPLTASEKQLKADREEQMIKDQKAREEEAQRALQQRKKEQIEATLSNKQKEQKLKNKGSKASSAKVSVVSFVAILVAAFGLFAAFMDMVIKDFVLFEFVNGESVIDIMKTIFAPSLTSQAEIVNFMFALLILLFLVVLVLIALQSLVRLFTGRVRRRGFINMLLPLLAVIFAAGIALTKAVANNFSADMLLKDGLGWIIAAGVAVVLFVLYLIAGARKKKKPISQAKR